MVYVQWVPNENKENNIENNWEISSQSKTIHTNISRTSSSVDMKEWLTDKETNIRTGKSKRKSRWI